MISYITDEHAKNGGCEKKTPLQSLNFALLLACLAGLGFPFVESRLRAERFKTCLPGVAQDRGRALGATQMQRAAGLLSGGKQRQAKLLQGTRVVTNWRA